MNKARRLKKKEVLSLALKHPIGFAKAKLSAKLGLKGKLRVISKQKALNEGIKRKLKQKNFGY